VLYGRKQTNDLGCGVTVRCAKSALVEADGVALRWPDRGLESAALDEHAHRAIECSMESFGIALGIPPAHARGHPSSIAVRGRIVPPRLLHRPHNETLQQTGAGKHCGWALLWKYLWLPLVRLES
jgi:hypothetical protein